METFHIDYSVFVDMYLQTLGKCYNYKTGIYREYNGTDILLRKSARYTIPPELLELINCGNIITKDKANPLIFHIEPANNVCAYYLSNYLPENFDGTAINFLDWIPFTKENLADKLYINCNPDSKYYGNVMYIHVNDASASVEIKYNSLSELLIDNCIICQF